MKVKEILKIFVLIILLFLSILLGYPQQAHAEYSREYVIDNTIFQDSTSMSATNINDFLRAHGSWLADYTIPEYISVPYPLANGGLGYVDARQNYNSSLFYGKTVAQLISEEAIEHNINPRVILTVLQKESSAITRSTTTPTTRAWPLFYMYNESMGSCLNSGINCNDTLYRQTSIDFGGVGQQIAYATAWFRSRYNNYANQSFTVTVDGTTFTCQNVATRIFYLYTPHISSWQNFYNIYLAWFEDPTYGPPVPNQPYNLTTMKSLNAQSWSASHSQRIISGDFEDDGVADLASLYDYGNCAMGLFVFESENGFTPRALYYTGPNTWCVRLTSNLIKGNFDNDGIDDLALMYDYGSASVGLWLFKSSTNFNPVSVKYLTPNSWQPSAASEIAAGDFDEDGIDDIAALYDYGTATTALWVFESNNQYCLKQYYNSGINNFSLAHSKSLVVGNFDGDTNDDLATLYDYGNTSLAVIQLKSTRGYIPQAVFISSANSYSLSATSNLISGNFDQSDTTDDLSIVYDYGQSTIGIFNFNSINSFLPLSKYWSGRKNFSIDAANRRFSSGDFDNDGDIDISALYNYGQLGTVFFSFIRSEFD